MKAKYFPNVDFLNAKLGDNPSYMWRSLVAAQTILKQGCRRNIGTGSDTFVCKSPWLPCVENGYITTALPCELEGIKVCNLMETNEKRWDDEILGDLFNDRDAQLIKNISLPLRDRNDSWLWLFDSKGELTVKSCYRQLVGEQSTQDAGFWKKLWSLQLPGKIQFFIWRTCRLFLPTTVELINKRVNLDSKCSYCRMENEDAKHVLFDCQFARQVWESLGLVQCTQVDSGDTILGIFKSLFNNGTREQCVLLASICWSLWNRRNKWVWNRVEVSVFGTTSAAMNLLSDWKAAQVERANSAPASTSSVRKWQAPDQGW